MAAVALHYGWRVGMMVAGLLACHRGGHGLCWWLRARDRPQAIGLHAPPVGGQRHDALEVA